MMLLLMMTMVVVIVAMVMTYVEVIGEGRCVDVLQHARPAVGQDKRV